MAESAEEFYARVHALEPLPAPSITTWSVFPWEVRDGALVPRLVSPPEPEKPRTGEDGCPSCTAKPDELIWTDEHWHVRAMPPSGLPLVLMLEPHEHLDLPDLDDGQAAEWGQLCARLARIVESLPHVARCHVGRWGDGAEHLHTWFFARLEGIESTKGSLAIEWDDILPPGPADVRARDLAEVARKLATHGGRALV
jgi:hypothetical protein